MIRSPLLAKLATFILRLASGPSPAPDDRPAYEGENGRPCPRHFPPEVCYAVGVVNTVDLELGERLRVIVNGPNAHREVLALAEEFEEQGHKTRHLVTVAVADVLLFAGQGHAAYVLERLLSALNIGTTHPGSIPLFSVHVDQGVFHVHGLTHVGLKPASRAQALVWSHTAHAYLKGGLQAAEDYSVTAEPDYDDHNASGRHVIARLVDFEVNLTSGHLGHFGMVRDERRMEVNRRIRARREQAAADRRADEAGV